MRLREIVVDSIAPAKLARFWEAVLDDYAIRPYDREEIARLAKLGFTPETDPSVALDSPLLTIFFQKTDKKKTQRNRIHLDLEAANLDRSLQSMLQLGAQIRDRHAEFVVMLDPEGNEFCVKLEKE